jgi:hypothetical protein
VDQSLESNVPHAAGSPTLEHYLDGAVRLRQAATWNTFDSNLAGDLPRRIIPVVDADVIRLFMAPAEETNYVNPFPSLESGSATRRAWNDPLALVAAATAEFIFLTGTIEILGQHVGNWKEALRITPTHLHDVESMLHQVRVKIVDGLLSIEELEDEAIERLDPLLAKSRRDGDRGLAALVQALPNSLRDLYLGPMYEAERWVRLRGDQVLLRLDGLPEATTEVLNPDEKLIERWREPLFKALTPSPASIRHQSRRNDPQSMTRRAGERARRDAAALASVTALNEAGLQAGSERGWRAILISGDEHLHRVYSRWAWETSGSSLRPERYVLRRPLQFTPVLNMASMSKDPATADIFKKLTNALDLTVDMLLDQPGGVPNPYLLEFHWQRHRGAWLKTLDQEGIQDHLVKCNNYWLEAINHINARNHPYLTRDYHRLFERLREAFDEPDARRELINHTKSIVEGIDVEHFRLVLEETIYELTRLAMPMRMPFLVRTEFPDFLGDGGSTSRFLFGESQLCMIRHGAAELQEVAEKILASSSARGAFLTAILAAAAGSFVRASHLIARARELARDDPDVDPPLLSEMTYFHALILRLNVSRPEDYKHARAIVQGIFPAASSDGFQRARAYSEAAALELQWYAVDAMHPKNRIISDEQRSHLNQGRDYLKLARDSVSWPLVPSASRHERELELQIVVNTIALNTYIKLAEGDPDFEALRWAREQLEVLLRGAIEDADYITELWRRAAEWLIEPTPESERAVRLHCKQTLVDRGASEMPTADRNDLERIAAYFQSPLDLVER